MLQLYPERHVTARSCVELRYVDVTAAERQSLLVPKFLHAVHATHACASCIVYAAALSAALRPHCATGGDDTEASIHFTCRTSLASKGASAIYRGAAETPNQTCALCRFVHRHVVCQGNGSHRSPTLEHAAGERPSLQDVRGRLCMRCHGREVAWLGAWQPVESSMSMRQTACLMELWCHRDHVCCVALQLLLVQWLLHRVWTECWSSNGAQESHGTVCCEA